MPKYAELVNTILGVVSDEFEVSVEDILSKSKRLEIVDARHTAIKIIYLKGVYASRISQIFKMSLRNIHYVLTDYDNRIKANAIVRNNYEIIKTKLGIAVDVTRSYSVC